MARVAATSMEEEFGFKLVRLARHWRWRADERLKPLGLTQAKAVTLLYLSRGGDGMLQRELAEVIGIEAPTLVRLLDSLEELGLVERRDAETDRRVKTVHLTGSAPEMLRRLDRIALELRRELLAGVSEDALIASVAVFDAVMLNSRERMSPRPAQEVLRDGHG